MNFKIDTREKFTMITPVSDFFSDKLTAEFKKTVNNLLQDKTNIIANLSNILHINERVIKEIAALQQEFYAQNISFVVCGLPHSAQVLIKELELDEVMNIAPTETEAFDIVQMEVIERELLDDE